MLTTLNILQPFRIALLLASVLTAATNALNGGIQTHFGDISFAGGMSYDSEHQTIYVTGQVSSHSCFVGVLKRVESPKDGGSLHLEFLSKQIFHERAICQTIAFRRDVSRPGNALLLSLSEEGGLLTNQREEGSRKAKHYGGLVDLRYSADGKSSEYSPDQSVLMYQTAAVTIPRSITYDPKHTNRVFVASMTSEASDIEYRNALGTPHETDGLGLTTIPNLTPGGGLLKYGNNFAMTVESIRLGTEVAGAEIQWRKPFGVKQNVDSMKRSGVTVGQILSIEDGDANGDANAVYVVGSVLGANAAFGHLELEQDDDYERIAGFVTKLNPDTGDLVASRRFVFNPSESIATAYDSSVADTYIEAVCESGEDDAIFVVGSYTRSATKSRRSRSLEKKNVRSRSQAQARSQKKKKNVRSRSQARSLQTEDYAFGGESGGEDNVNGNGNGEVSDSFLDNPIVDDDQFEDEDDDDDDNYGYDENENENEDNDNDSVGRSEVGEGSDSFVDNPIVDDDQFEDDDDSAIDDDAAFTDDENNGGADIFDDNDKNSGNNDVAEDFVPNPIVDDDQLEDDDDDDDDKYADDDSTDAERTTITTPFVAKLRASTLETIWKKDFQSTTDARVLGCGVDSESQTMYLAGVVEDGGELVGRTVPLEGDDVFVMRLHTSDGAVAWAKQLGTTMDDRLAYGGSGLAVLGGSKGVLLMGDTQGQLYSVKNKDSEIFIVEVDADGRIPDRTESTGMDYSSSASEMELSNPMSTDGGKETTVDTGKKKIKPSRGSKTNNGSGTNNSSDSNAIKTSVQIGQVFSFLFSMVFVTAAFLGVLYICSRKKREATERALVFSYLQNFDLEDIDVKQAATGGWHGTYVGNLAHGLNVRESEDLSESYSDNWTNGDHAIFEGKGKTAEENDLVERRINKFSHSSVVRDILFMDSEEFYPNNANSGESKNDEKPKRDGIIRDPTSDDGKEDDPWGSEII
mmetsp:Transcript_3093/g.8512  ORF Transcript_3093/g.8512 Transcript_3093/m.8512 type:complete len:972 (+) Transcript_3093:516-3431(+)